MTNEMRRVKFKGKGEKGERERDGERGRSCRYFVCPSLYRVNNKDRRVQVNFERSEQLCKKELPTNLLSFSFHLISRNVFYPSNFFFASFIVKGFFLFRKN